ncbi:MAG: TetR family transcriptional regulator [Actinophytocola sp.]|nr:TetR family transcriptional regulator [Actinophytocola sp.]
MTADRRRTTTRATLVDVALMLFRRQGISGTGVAEVCHAAGTSKGVFAHHFPGGKKALVVACLERNGEDFATLLDRTVARSDGSAAAVVQALFSRYAELMRRYGTDIGCPMAAAAVDSRSGVAGAGSPAAVAVDRWRAEITGRHAALAGHDELVLATLEGALVLARATGDPGALERTGGRLAEILRSAQ